MVWDRVFDPIERPEKPQARHCFAADPRFAAVLRTA
jgi:hypothetical protein